jgi:TRAP-type C4-dicarboxylate transport system permease small subunit
LDERLRLLKKVTRALSWYFEQVGLIGLLVMFAANLIDVVGAKALARPLTGALEVISFAQVVAIAPAIAFGLILGRHIQVDFFVALLPHRIQAVLNAIISFIAFLLFAVLLWQTILYGHSLQVSGEIGATSYIPLFPFAYLIAICCVPVCLFFLVDLLDSLCKAGES